MSEATEETGETRWWVMPRLIRWIWIPLMWLFVPFGAFLFVIGIVNLFSHDADKWSNVALGILWPGFVFYFSRSFLVAVGVEGDNLLVRLPFPGWTERLPLASVRGAVVMIPQTVLKFTAPRRLPMLFGRRWPLPDPVWDDLVENMKARLQPEDRWRDERGRYDK